MGQGQAPVERHDVVEVLAGVTVLAVGVVDQALQAPVAPVVPAQRHLHGQVDAVQTGRLVRVLEYVELVGRPTRTPHGIDVVANPSVVGRGLELPLTSRRVPVEGHRDRVCLLRLEIDISDVAIAVTDEVVHDRCHGPGRPGVALVQVG